MRISHLFACSLLVIAASPMDAQVTVNTLPSRVFGHLQLDPPTGAPNLVVGREFTTPQGIAIDTAATPPTLYVSDTANNRILVWRNAASFANGARADLVIGQQDFVYTGCGGPTLTSDCKGPKSTVSAGLYQPMGLAVDGQHNLYVVDSHNNRILRFPQPLAQTGEQTADLIIGQTRRDTGQANGGTGRPSASTVWLCCDSNGNGLRSTLAFDSQGNLYFADTGNNRVLRYPASALGAGAPNGPAADLVLGQQDFTSYTAPAQNATNRASKDVLLRPSGIAFDQASGRLYVADDLARVVVYGPGLPPVGGRAVRIMGISLPPQGQQVAPDTYLFGPAGVVMIGNKPAVLDAAAHRIMIFPPFEQWDPETESQPSPRALGVGGLIGQVSYQLDNKSNRNQPEPSANTLSFPLAATFFNDELFVADSGNNRVLVFPQQSGIFNAASRVLGQDGFELNSINLAEGRELWLGTRGGIVVDQNSSPPRLYVADTFNNRVLGFADARKVVPGATADIVIGQPDFRRTNRNYKILDPNNDRATPAASSLNAPTGLALDPDGNLWVADSGNGRVLRFPRPFDQSQPNFPNADLVIGQPNFTTGPPYDLVSDSRLSEPYGLAFDGAYGLFVSDRPNHRVLYFPAPYSNGMRAAKVFGQADFISRESGSAKNRMNTPAHVAVDSDGRLLVADTVNNRVLLFKTGRLASETNQFAQNSLDGLNRPYGVYVSPITGEIWVAETGSGRSLRFRKFDALSLTEPNSPTAVIPVQSSLAAPLAITQDQFGALYVADTSNRIALHYPVAVAVNGASFKNPFPNRDIMITYFTSAIQGGEPSLQQLLASYPPLAPGMIASLFPLDISLGGTKFGDQTLVFNQLPNPLPLPRELAGIRVMVNGVAAPLFFVAPGQINFQVPAGTPTAGAVEIRVENAATGQIIAIGKAAMAQAAPGLFTAEPTGTGQVAALNYDNGKNTVNSASNPIARGDVIQLFGTGQGLAPNMPGDGEASPGSPVVNTDGKPDVIMQPGPASFLDPKYVEFSGLAPGFVGVWQVNVRVPMEVTPGTVLVVLRFKEFPSNNPSVPQQIRTTIAVKQ